MQTAHILSIGRRIGSAIAQARRVAGIKQSTAAKLLGIARPTLSGYENGRHKGLTIDLLAAMSLLYRQPFDSFFRNDTAVEGKPDLFPNESLSDTENLSVDLLRLKEAMLFLIKQLP